MSLKKSSPSSCFGAAGAAAASRGSEVVGAALGSSAYTRRSAPRRASAPEAAAARARLPIFICAADIAVSGVLARSVAPGFSEHFALFDLYHQFSLLARDHPA